MRSRTAAVVLAGYLVVLGFLTLWPTHPDASWAPFTRSMLRGFATNPVTSWISYEVLNELANAFLFVVFGIVAILAFGVRGWWWVFVAGAMAAGGLEIAQTLLVPTRTSDILDAISGAAGAALGVALGVAILAAAPGRTRKRQAPPSDG